MRVILNHRAVKSRFNSQPRGSECSDWSFCRPRPLSVHCSLRDHERCRLKERVERHSEYQLARDKIRQAGHGKCAIAREPLDGTIIQVVEKVFIVVGMVGYTTCGYSTG